MKRIVFIILGFLSSLSASAQYNLEVGDCEFLALNSPAGFVRSATWHCDSGLKLTEESEVGAIVEVTRYFSGSAYVQVSYVYEYLGSYDNNMHAGHSSKSYSITCIGGTASISEESLELSVGQSYILKWKRSMEYGTPTWTSSDEDVVTINKNGKVTAVSPGKARITLDPITAAPCYCEVNVRTVPAQTIKLVPEQMEILIGKTATLKPEYTPNYASAIVTWRSENNAIATVSSSGIVKGVSSGTTNIIATTDNGLIARATVSVLPEPETISLPETLEISGGYQFKLTPVITPNNCYAKYSWESSDSAIIVVDNEGYLRAKKSGVAEITVATQNMKTATCRVKVINPSEGMDYRNVRIRINSLKSLFNDINKE